MSFRYLKDLTSKLHPLQEPLSPFLFDLVVEGLSVLFKRASIPRYFKGIDFMNGLSLSHLQYTDDTLFVPNNDNSLMNFKRILK